MEVYFTDRVPRMWARSTAIIANGQSQSIWVAFFLSMVRVHILAITEYLYCILDFFFDFLETPLSIDGISNNYKNFSLKLQTIQLCIFILYV